MIPKIKEINRLGYVVKLDQWGDEWRHWRGGLDWFGAENYVFVCEKKTFAEVVNCLLDYARENPKQTVGGDRARI